MAGVLEANWAGAMSSIRHSADVTAVITGIAAWKGWLLTLMPHSWSEAAGLASFVYITIRILESETVKRLIKRVRAKWAS